MKDTYRRTYGRLVNLVEGFRGRVLKLNEDLCFEGDGADRPGFEWMDAADGYGASFSRQFFACVWLSGGGALFGKDELVLEVISDPAMETKRFLAMDKDGNLRIVFVEEYGDRPCVISSPLEVAIPEDEWTLLENFIKVKLNKI